MRGTSGVFMLPIQRKRNEEQLPGAVDFFCTKILQPLPPLPPPVTNILSSQLSYMILLRYILPLRAEGLDGESKD